MIRTRRGKVKAKGYPAEIITDYMCITLGILENYIIPVYGTENAKEELCKMIDEVLDAVNESEEENG